MKFYQCIQNCFKNHPHKVALHDGISPKGGVTYAELDTLSAKVHRYLKEHGIGQEDFVSIFLPRGVEPLIAMIGVIRAGAAFVILEEGYLPERVAFIERDCNCRLVLNYDAWQEIQKLEPLEGFEPVDAHDAACAVYTSGSSGNPKGVLHEYGNYDRVLDSMPARFNRFALISPLNFVVTITWFSVALRDGATFFVVPYSVSKNPALTSDYFVLNNISEAFCVASIYGLYSQIPTLKTLILSSEPANNLYSDNENLAVYNVFGMTESMFAISIMRLDRPYSKAPIGRPSFDLRLTLRDGEGNEVQDGQEGELCFDNPYCRGYINRPDENAKAFVGGECRTGDLAQRLPDGDFVIIGRIGDMVKINGNRVEPAEVERAFSEATGISDVMAKGFDDGKASFIALYYLGEHEIDEEATRTKMLEHIPYYMVPSLFLRLDVFPRTSSGKLSRRLLPKPEIKKAPRTSVCQADYEAADPTVKALCDAFARVLNLGSFGVDDDFYQYGGTSATSIEAVGHSKLPGLSVGQIFRGRTPRAVAKLYLEELPEESSQDDEARLRAAMAKSYPITPEQRYMLDYLFLAPKSTMQNLPVFYKVVDAVDADGFCKAANDAVRRHPALYTILTINDDSEWVQHYAPELFDDVSVERVSEEELEEISGSLVRPFYLKDKPLFRLRLFQTEKGLYFFWDSSHLFSDGGSIQALLADIINIYLNGREANSSAFDAYYLMLEKRMNIATTGRYAKDKDYYEQRYGGVSWSRRLATETRGKGRGYDEVRRTMEVPLKQLEALQAESKTSMTGLCLAAQLLALASYNNRSEVLNTWVYNGRDDAGSEDVVGLLFRELPVGVKVVAQTRLSDYLLDVMDQINEGIAHSSYPWVSLHSDPLSADSTSFNYQNMIGTERDLPIALESLEFPEDEYPSPGALEIDLEDDGDTRLFTAVFSPDRFTKEDVERFLDMMMDMIGAFAANRNNLDISLEALFEQCSFEFPTT